MTALTSSVLASVARGTGLCDSSKQWIEKERVKVFTVSGIQVGIAGIGEGDNRLTFPPHFVVKEALELSHAHWLRFATAQEQAQTSTQWYRAAPFKPASFIYHDGSVALDCHTMGLKGPIITALEQAPPQPWEEKPCADVSGITTPPTPT